MITKLLQQGEVGKSPRVMDKAGWVALLAGAGMDEAAMRRWHALFEQSAQEAHQDFLKSLTIPDEEIERIRRWSQEMATKGLTETGAEN